MGISSAMAIGLSGLRAAGHLLHVRAHHLANQQTPDFQASEPVLATQVANGQGAGVQVASPPTVWGDPSNSDFTTSPPEIADGLVGLIQAEELFNLNLAVIVDGGSRFRRSWIIDFQG